MDTADQTFEEMADAFQSVWDVMESHISNIHQKCKDDHGNGLTHQKCRDDHGNSLTHQKGKDDHGNGLTHQKGRDDHGIGLTHQKCWDDHNNGPTHQKCRDDHGNGLTHQTRRFQAIIVTGSVSEDENYLTEILILATTLKIQLKITLEDENERMNNMRFMVRCLLEIYVLLTRQELSIGTAESIDYNIIIREWDYYTDLLQEKQAQMDGMLKKLAECKGNELYDDASSMLLLVWDQVFVTLSNGTPLHEGLSKVQELRLSSGVL